MATNTAVDKKIAAADARQAQGFDVDAYLDDQDNVCYVTSKNGQPLEVIGAEDDRAYALRLAPDTNPYLPLDGLLQNVTEGRRL